MKRRRIAWILLFAIALTLVGCGKADALKGTWTQVRSMRNEELNEKIENGTLIHTYTFNGHGKGEEMKLRDGTKTTIPFEYELIERGTTILVIDGIRIPYAFVGDTLQMQITQGGGKKDFFVFERTED